LGEQITVPKEVCVRTEIAKGRKSLVRKRGGGVRVAREEIFGERERSPIPRIKEGRTSGGMPKEIARKRRLNSDFESGDGEQSVKALG